MKEFETRIMDINIDEIRNKMTEIKAENIKKRKSSK